MTALLFRLWLLFIFSDNLIAILTNNNLRNLCHSILVQPRFTDVFEVVFDFLLAHVLKVAFDEIPVLSVLEQKLYQFIVLPVRPLVVLLLLCVTAICFLEFYQIETELISMLSFMNVCSCIFINRNLSHVSPQPIITLYKAISFIFVFKLLYLDCIWI